MFQNAITTLQLIQIPVRGEVLTAEEASLVFSDPKFLVALFAGILMAFAFQLLLTNRFGSYRYFGYRNRLRFRF